MGYGTSIRDCIQFRQYSAEDSILQEYENIGPGLGSSIVATLVSKLPAMQTPNHHIVMDNYFTSSALPRYLRTMEIAARRMVRANRMENAPLRDMVKMNKEKDHQMLSLMCLRTSLQYVGEIIKLWIWFPPLLVNNQCSRSNLIVIVKNGEWILNNEAS